MVQDCLLSSSSRLEQISSSVINYLLMSPKVAIVTGSAQGIGKAIALRLAKDGFDIVISDMQYKEEEMVSVCKEAEAVREGGRFIAIPCDVSKEDQVQALVDEVVEKLGRIDCVSQALC